MTAPHDRTPMTSDALVRPEKAPILTVQQHILREQDRIPGAAGEFSLLMSGLTLAAKPPDDEHPYGHGRVETITGLLPAQLE